MYIQYVLLKAFDEYTHQVINKFKMYTNYNLTYMYSNANLTH